MKATTSKPAASKTATKEAPSKSATDTKATTLSEASVTIINDEAETFEVNHDVIAQTAYHLWATEGYQSGLHEEYWLRAEASLQPKKVKK